MIMNPKSKKNNENNSSEKSSRVNWSNIFLNPDEIKLKEKDLQIENLNTKLDRKSVV